ncbi:MAG TPA: hypothetical protein VIV10_03370 [Gemmatimonadales bacterium]
MTAPDERRRLTDRRTVLDRRSNAPRPGQQPAVERRSGERRTGQERRLSILSAEDQIAEAVRLLTRVVETGSLPDDERRSLEAAMVRLRFALDRLEQA